MSRALADNAKSPCDMQLARLHARRKADLCGCMRSLSSLIAPIKLFTVTCGDMFAHRVGPLLYHDEVLLYHAEEPLMSRFLLNPASPETAPCRDMYVLSNWPCVGPAQCFKTSQNTCDQSVTLRRTESAARREYEIGI